MGLRRRIVKTLLKKYVKNLQERHIHVSVARGVVRIDDAVLEIAPLSELLVGLVPDGVEITEAKASDLRLEIPWKHLKSRSTTVTIGEVSVSLTQHPVTSSGLSEKPCQYWATALKQRKQMLQEAQALAKKGPLPIKANDVANAIAAGLQINIEMLNLKISKCPRACEESVGVVQPHALISIADFFFGPVDQRLQRLTAFSQSDELAYQSKDVRASAISLRVLSGGQLKKLLHPTALRLRIWTYMPSDGKVVCPFPCTTRLEVDLDTVCIDGDEDQVQELIRTLIEFSDAMELRTRALGAIPWSNDDYAKCYGEEKKASSKKAPDAMTRRPSTGSISGVFRRKSSRPSSPNGSVAGSDVGSNAGSSAGSVAGKSKSRFSKFLPSTSLLTRKTNHFEGATKDAEGNRSPSAFLLDDLDAEDSDTFSAEDDPTSGLDETELGDAVDFHTPMAGGLDAYNEEQMSARLSEAVSEFRNQELLHTWNHGSARQDTIAVEVGTLRVGILLPSEGRAECTLTKLSYRNVCHAWLSEAEQICATRIGGRFLNATAAPGFERGGNSLDTIINLEHHLSIRTCQFSYSEFDKSEKRDETPEDGTLLDQGELQVDSGTSLVLLEPMVGNEDNIDVKWRGTCGEPCRDIANGNMFVWPLEAVVRGVKLLYLPAPFQRLGEIVKPVIAEMVDWDEEQQIANSRAKSAQWSKTVAFKNVAVQQPFEGKEFPHRVKIHSATLENVTSNFSDIATFFGLAHEEPDDKKEIRVHQIPDGSDLNVQNMNEEQLRAEVMMWRSTYGLSNGEQTASKPAHLHLPI